MSTLHQQLLHHLPLADPSVMVTSTITSSDVLLLSIRPTDNGVMFSSMEYRDSLNDNTATAGQYITQNILSLILVLPLSFIITSVVVVFPITTSQGGAGILSISLNVSLHSAMLSLMMSTVNDFDISPAAISTEIDLLRKSLPPVFMTK